MKLDEVIDKRISAFNRLCDSVIMIIEFNEDKKDLISTHLARKATLESEKIDIFNFNNEL
jgi:hypothetical protein